MQVRSLQYDIRWSFSLSLFLSVSLSDEWALTQAIILTLWKVEPETPKTGSILRLRFILISITHTCISIVPAGKCSWKSYWWWFDLWLRSATNFRIQHLNCFKWFYHLQFNFQYYGSSCYGGAVHSSFIHFSA